MKHTFGSWNRHVKPKGTLDTRVFGSLRHQFQDDIHNGRFIYHYELSRYHVLGMNLVAPVDHYFQISRRKKNLSPMGTLDHLIISMGIHLAHIHGNDNVAILSADNRLTDILAKCKSHIPAATVAKLKLNDATEITGRRFSPVPEAREPGIAQSLGRGAKIFCRLRCGEMTLDHRRIP